MALVTTEADPVPKIFGFSYLNVLSGSMDTGNGGADDIEVGSLVFISNHKDYKVGDIVTYFIPETTKIPVTHKIISISGDIVTTQGTANNTPDEPFHISYIEGRVTKVAPGWGNLLEALKQPEGLLFLAVLAFALMFIPEYIYRIIVPGELPKKVRAERTLARAGVGGPTVGVPVSFTIDDHEYGAPPAHTRGTYNVLACKYEEETDNEPAHSANADEPPKKEYRGVPADETAEALEWIGEEVPIDSDDTPSNNPQTGA